MKLKMRSLHYILLLSFVAIVCTQCKDVPKKEQQEPKKTVTPKKDNVKKDTTYTLITEKPEDVKVPEGMVWIPGGMFVQGAVPQDKMAMQHEKPAHKVAVDGFFMDITEVTNAQYAKFVKETGYITVAERAIDWEEMKKQVPEGTPKPHDSILQPGSLTFKKSKKSVPNLFDFSQWWDWTIGANWKHPNGPKSSIKGLDNHPVVQICYEDAMAYCNWAGRRLPTEAEWEYAANGGKTGTIFFWGDDKSVLSKNANSWEGEFPVENSKKDGYENRAPVKSYQPNGYGLYDMAGNVWEWTTDWYNVNYYKELAAVTTKKNPLGATDAYNPQNLYIKEKVIKGGSFLCSDSYCASYRISARMGSSVDSSAEHTGFRTVATVKMLK
ncbi:MULTISPECIES: formylglycine-generating enzyme family protein [unclassified Cellulophaga]|uniref:formylglycine-generating enzyme family protein n=1 Tax=unclassified Cellulophaga TaxID=2634405 RepID=UPI0026E48C29|nr:MULTISPECIES: formylglycine-generating enzyme family protein [unclassified Cellulophaga]MDO6492276.1 formylglycine-generating enzyme family protein [Cellulophaga sp. 2_MG-2023]MDO6493226.1 formylglycine-generating enzyme family protein [Cellulophaga sp. 3_MG-2023]